MALGKGTWLTGGYHEARMPGVGLDRIGYEMGHENSETVRIGKRWFNRATVGTAKRRLGSPSQRESGFATMKEAVSAAKKRSADSKPPRRKPKRG